MAQELLCDELCELLRPLIPTRPRRYRYPGRKRIDDRKVLTGILFVLKTGIPWQSLPLELGCGSGMTCWRRLREWQEAGVWQRLHELLLAKLQEAERIDWSRAVADSFVPAVWGAPRPAGSKTGPSPVNRRKAGSKHHLLTDARGVPLPFLLTAANRPDAAELEALLEAVPPVRGKRGQPRRRPQALLGDRGYHSRRALEALSARRITPLVARQRQRHGSGLGRQRWVVERTISWLHQHRRLRLRYERRADIHEALLSIACSLICFRALQGAF